MLFLIFSILAFSAPVTDNITVTIEISGLRSNVGMILLDLRDADNVPVKGCTSAIQDQKSVVVIRDLQKGLYSFRYFHDENENNKLDKYWFGAPREGYGFSNNAGGKFGPPAFRQTLFTLNSDTVINCTPHYTAF